MHYQSEAYLSKVLDDLVRDEIFLKLWRDLEDHHIKELLFLELKYNSKSYSDIWTYITDFDMNYFTTPERLEYGIFRDPDFLEFLVDILDKTFLREVTEKISDYFDSIWISNPQLGDPEYIPNSYFL